MAIVVKVSADNMEAIVEVERQSDQPLDIDAIRRALNEAGVTYGIDDKACADLVDSFNNAPPGSRFATTIARGTLPSHGEDGRMEMAVEYARNPVGQLRDSGSIDFHERGSFTPIARGQLIAHIFLPTAGTPGADVRGGAIRQNAGQRARLTAGQGTRIEAGGTELRAVRDGDLRCVGDLIEVMDMIRVPGNLDYSAGSIECEGPVRVEGDVLPGFHIRAGGDVWIGGVVDSAEVTSSGAVTVAQGVLKGSCVVAKRSIAVGYAREAYLESDGPITISREAINSTVVSGDSIRVPESGRVVGGRLLAQTGVMAGVAGQEKGVTTILAAGVDPLRELRAARLAADIRETHGIRSRVTRIKELSAADRHAIIDQLLARLAAKHAGSAEELAQLRQNDIRLAECRITIKRKIHPGVRIRIGKEELQIEGELPGATFHYDAESGQVIQV